MSLAFARWNAPSTEPLRSATERTNGSKPELSVRVISWVVELKLAPTGRPAALISPTNVFASPSSERAGPSGMLGRV